MEDSLVNKFPFPTPQYEGKKLCYESFIII
jgi:hypothetical protein